MKASCIIPTYGRGADVLQITLQALFDLGEEFFENCLEVFVIDQNRDPLSFFSWLATLDPFLQEKVDYQSYSVLDPQVMNAENFIRNNEQKKQLGKIQLIHFYGLSPSVTIAKNFAVYRATQELLLFFDDDVSVLPHTINFHREWQLKTSNAGMIGGRETIYPEHVGRSPLRETLISIAEKMKKPDATELKYKTQGHYVGRIDQNSFFFCRFDLLGSNLVEVDTVRGCNASLRRKIHHQVYGFDENFQGTALREESDFCLRIQQAGYRNYYLGDAGVLHRRQLGGCNNLARSYQSLLSKMDCELYFQYRHFLNVSPFYFFLRLLPLALESLKWSWGIGFLFLLQFTAKIFRLQRSEKARREYESNFRFKLSHP